MSFIILMSNNEDWGWSDYCCELCEMTFDKLTLRKMFRMVDVLKKINNY